MSPAYRKNIPKEMLVRGYTLWRYFAQLLQHSSLEFCSFIQQIIRRNRPVKRLAPQPVAANRTELAGTTDKRLSAAGKCRALRCLCSGFWEAILLILEFKQQRARTGYPYGSHRSAFEITSRSPWMTLSTGSLYFRSICRSLVAESVHISPSMQSPNSR